MAFDPAKLVPADQVAAFAKVAGARGIKQVAIANIDKQIALLADPAIEGKRTYEVKGDHSAFEVRVNNSAMVLETANVKGTQVEVRKMAVPAKDLKDAFLYYRKRIEAGDYDDQLTKLDTVRNARTDKMRATRATKKAAAKPA
ncbi:hypothetical protein KCP91_12215 [Microvirga sp. SRT01]|uniref:Uncharacterized protein n=1 Tax=Sphingomonas longa TaxID=2778730 RepID=A0ABS2D8A8_9SPHN|nr:MULTISPECIES: hypothetical protein [Alphaproteobacteria]MBM6577138.1 hypothetical protein [Sphingomonas sp. BT552]MBR7710182.1 hypothetical protein [Microvirga sp. SRT01]